MNYNHFNFYYYCYYFVYRRLAIAKEGFTEASLGLLANQRRRQLLTGLLKSLRTIKTLVTTVLITVPSQLCVIIHEK